MEIADIAQKVLDESAYLHIKGVHNGSATQLLAYKIEEHILANFELVKKPVWFGKKEHQMEMFKEV